MRKIVLLLVVMLLAGFSAKALVYTVVVPEGTKVCYIAGNMNGWTQQQMDQYPDDPTIFTIDLPEAQKADGYKYCCGPSWAFVEKSAEGGEISDRTYPDDGINIDYVEKWALEYDPDLDKEFTFNVTVPEGTNAIYVNGSFNGWSGFERLEQVTELTYTLTVRVIGSESVNYKYASGPSWDYEELQEDGTTLPTDRNLAEPESDDVVAKWKAIYDPDSESEFILNVTVPEETNAVYVAGSFDGWKSFKPLKKVTETTYTVTLKVEGLDEIEYKYLSGADWKYEEVISANRELAAADSPSDDVVLAWKEVGDTPTVTLFVTVPEGTEACYVAGSMNGWTPELMEKVTETTYTIMLDVVGFEEVEYKYLSGPDWKYEEVISANRKLAVADSPSDDVVAEWKAVYYLGIIDVNRDNISIITGKAALTVQCTGTATIELYTIQGALLNKAVAAGVYTREGLATGIYIVKVNNKAYKALVK